MAVSQNCNFGVTPFFFWGRDLICGTSEREEIMPKLSRAQNVRKVKVSYCIIRHFFLSESEQFVNEKVSTK